MPDCRHGRRITPLRLCQPRPRILGDLLCLDVEVSLLDGIVTVTVEGAAPEAVELCRFVSEELARRGYSGIAVRTEW